MSNEILNLRDTIVPKSDQLNAEQLLGAPITITVTGVSRGSADQPVVISYQNDNGRPYKPCKSMRKVLIFAWGENGNEWVGRSMTLFNEPTVKWGGVQVGGIRISHLSHIEKEISLSLTATKGKKEPFVIRKLSAQSAVPDMEQVNIHRQRLEMACRDGIAALQSAWVATPEPIRKALSPNGKCPDDLKKLASEPVPTADTRENPRTIPNESVATNAGDGAGPFF